MSPISLLIQMNAKKILKIVQNDDWMYLVFTVLLMQVSLNDEITMEKRHWHTQEELLQIK